MTSSGNPPKVANKSQLNDDDDDNDDGDNDNDNDDDNDNDENDLQNKMISQTQLYLCGHCDKYGEVFDNVFHDYFYEY